MFNLIELHTLGLSDIRNCHFSLQTKHLCCMYIEKYQILGTPKICYIPATAILKYEIFVEYDPNEQIHKPDMSVWHD